MQIKTTALISHEKLRGDLIAVFTYLIGSYGENQVRLFSGAYRERMKQVSKMNISTRYQELGFFFTMG